MLSARSALKVYAKGETAVPCHTIWKLAKFGGGGGGGGGGIVRQFTPFVSSTHRSLTTNRDAVHLLA